MFIASLSLTSDLEVRSWGVGQRVLARCDYPEQSRVGCLPLNLALSMVARQKGVGVNQRLGASPADFLLTARLGGIVQWTRGLDSEW